MSLEQLPSTHDKLIVTCQLPNTRADFAFSCWIAPELLTDWWPPEATIDAWLGGHYRLAWPTLQQTLQGVYTLYDPPHALAFTWKWGSRAGARRTVARSSDI